METSPQPGVERRPLQFGPTFSQAFSLAWEALKRAWLPLVAGALVSGLSMVVAAVLIGKSLPGIDWMATMGPGADPDDQAHAFDNAGRGFVPGMMVAACGLYVIGAMVSMVLIAVGSTNAAWRSLGVISTASRARQAAQFLLLAVVLGVASFVIVGAAVGGFTALVGALVAASNSDPLVIGVIILIGMGAGLVLFVCLFLLWARLICTFALVSRDGMGPFQAIRESFAITAGSTWKIAVLTFVVSLAASIPVSIVNQIVITVLSATLGGPGYVAGLGLNGVLSAVTAVAMYCLSVAVVAQIRGIGEARPPIVQTSGV